MDDDLLTSHGIRPDGVQNTYGVQAALQRFQFRQHLESERQRVPIGALDPTDEGDEMLDDDLLLSNPVGSPAGVFPGAPEASGVAVPPTRPEATRFVREVRTLVSINSADRLLYEEVLLDRNPDTGTYAREVVDEHGHSTWVTFTADDLNHEFVPGPLDPQFPFVARGEDIYRLVPVSPTPGDYTVPLPQTYTNVKSIRLVGTEVPHTLWPVDASNNVVIVDVIDRDILLSEEEEDLGLTQTIPMVGQDTPFFLVEIPEGKYSAPELVQAIQDLLNAEVQEHSAEHFVDLFSITYEPTTDRVAVVLNQPAGRHLAFHLRFHYVASAAPSTLLYYMLGFRHPHAVDQYQRDLYDVSWSNYAGSSRPFRHVDLNPARYVYLSLVGYPTMVDIRLTDDIFAKVTLPVQPGQVAYNTFVSNPVVFPNPIPQLQKLHLRWLDPRPGHDVVDFGYREHSITLELVRYVDNLTMNEQSTHRGLTDLTSYSQAVLTSIR